MYERRFLAELQQRIHDDLTRLHAELGDGKLLANEPGQTGIQYARHVGKIAGLRAALTHVRQIDDDLSGRKEKEKK